MNDHRPPSSPSPSPSWKRAVLGLASGLFALACSDGVLDIAGREHAGGQAGSSGAGLGESGLFARDFCQGGLGDCVFRAGELSCSGDVGETSVTVVDGPRARLVVDMALAAELKVAVQICDPSGYVFNIGDSPTVNGGGGDWGQFQHDAEVMIYDADLTGWSSDVGYEQTSADSGHHQQLLSRAGYLSAQGCSVRTLYLRDQYIADADDPSLRTRSPTALRINPSTDTEGTPDARWYLGINRVVSDHFNDVRRVGSGVEAVRLCFRVPPPAPPPRSGP